MPILESLRTAFFGRPLPDAAFELEPGRLTGLRPAGRGRAPRSRCVRPLPSGALAPSFDRPNVSDASAVRAAVDRAKDELRLRGGSAAVLIPEPCVRVFILTVEGMPASSAERDAFLRWRVGKQMPLLPDDLRLACDAPAGAAAGRVIVSVAREAVIREYEGFFEAAGLSVGAVTVPALSLINLVGVRPAANGLLLDIEPDCLSFLAFMDGSWVLYRQKAFGLDLADEARADLVANEVDNTVHFLEDRERRKVERVWVRSADEDEGPDIVSRLNAALPLAAEVIDYDAPGDWDGREKAALAPLMGLVA